MEQQTENQTTEIVKPSLTERLDNWWLEKNKYKGFNGGCAISADPAATLLLLRENVLPRQENLDVLVRTSVEGHDKQHRSLEEIWAGRIAEGATHVGVLDGSFHFFKGEDILPEDNVDLRIPALPPILQFRDQEKQMIAQMTHVKEERFREENRLPESGGGTPEITGQVSDQVSPPEIPDVLTGDNISAGDTGIA